MADRQVLFLDAVRDLLTSVATLPARRAWMNETLDPKPSPLAPFVTDRIVTFDTFEREMGGPDYPAWRRSSVLYAVDLRYPKTTGMADVLECAADIHDVFHFALHLVDVGGQPLSLLAFRQGPSLPDDQWLVYPVFLSLQFDHA